MTNFDLRYYLFEIKKEEGKEILFCENNLTYLDVKESGKIEIKESGYSSDSGIFPRKQIELMTNDELDLYIIKSLYSVLFNMKYMLKDILGNKETINWIRSRVYVASGRDVCGDMYIPVINKYFYEDNEYRSVKLRCGMYTTGKISLARKVIRLSDMFNDTLITDYVKMNYNNEEYVVKTLSYILIKESGIAMDDSYKFIANRSVIYNDEIGDNYSTDNLHDAVTMLRR